MMLLLDWRCLCENALDRWTLYNRTCSCVQTCKWWKLCTLVWREEPEKFYCMKIYGLHLQANSLHVYPPFFFFFKSYALCRYMYFYWFNEYFWLSWFKNRVYSVIMRWELTGFKTEHVNSHNNLCPTISQTSSLIFLISADPKIMKLVIDVKFSLAFEKRNEGKENQKSENAWEDSQYLA